jgi:O-antigen/teichoic acid export membrane protein
VSGEKNATANSAPLADRVRSAVFWRSGSQIIAQLVTWTATLAVVRLLDPRDYGLFAMTQVLMAVLNFLSGESFASSLIRAESVTREKVRQVFGLLLLFNGGLAVAQFMIAPFAAAYFRQPIVEQMLHVQAMFFLATPFIALPSALLARKLDFRKQAVVNLGAAAVSATTALVCALMGLGVWSLVMAPLAMFWTRAIGLTLAARELVWPSFNFAGAGAIIRFGGALMLCQFFWIIQSQSDIFLAGRQLNPHELGLYAEALFIALIFTAKFVPPLNEVAFPSYAQLIKDGGSVAYAFRKVAGLTMLVAMPLYFGMAATAAPLVETLFGPKWHEMVPLVRTVALTLPFFALQIIFSPVTNAMGRTHVYVTTSIAGAIIMPCAFFFGIRWGVQGLALAWTVAAPLLLAITITISLPHIGMPFSALLTAVKPAIGAAIPMAVTVWLIERQLQGAIAAPIELALLVGAGASIYVGLLYFFARQTLDDLWRLITKRQLTTD